MRLITIGDIHGNYEALKMVIEDAKNNYGRTISGFVFLGDYCGDFADGNLVIDLIEELKKHYPVYIIKGNREDTVTKYYNEKIKGNDISWSLDTTMGVNTVSCIKMNDHQLEFLTTLPKNLIISIPNIKPILLTHIMPLSEDDLKLINDHKIEYILTAHTHERHMGTYDNLKMFNPGSVGLTDDGIPGASYGVMTYRNEQWLFETRLIPYDYNKAINNLRSNYDLYERCKHWGYLLELSVKYGMNVTALYMFEVYRITREMASGKKLEEIEPISKVNNAFGQGRYGNVGPYKEHLRETVFAYNKDNNNLSFDEIYFKTADNNNRPSSIPDEIYEMALHNIDQFLSKIKIEAEVYTGRRER